MDNRQEMEVTPTLSDLQLENESLREAISSLKGTVVELSCDLKTVREEKQRLQRTVETLLKGNQMANEMNGAPPRKRARTVEMVDEPEVEEPLSKGSQIGTEGKVAACLFGFLSLDDILNCRLISKSWKEAVDQFLEDPAHRVDPPAGTNSNMSEPRSKHLIAELDKRTSFQDEASMKRFTRHFGDYQLNPFVGRCVSFSVSPRTLRMTNGPPCDSSCDEDSFSVELTLTKIMKKMSINFWTRVEKFLSVFGSDIWHLTIQQEACGLTPARLHEILQMCLRHTPNLKTLVIHGAFQKLFDDPNPRPRKIETPNRPTKIGITNRTTQWSWPRPRLLNMTARKSTYNPPPKPRCHVYSSYRNSLKKRVADLKNRLNSEPSTPQPNVKAVKCFLKETIRDERDDDMDGETYKETFEGIWSSELLKTFKSVEEIGVNLILESEGEDSDSEKGVSSSNESSSDDDE